MHPYESHLPITSILTTRIIATFPFLMSLRHHKGDTTESDPKLLCWEVDCASATHLQSRKFVSKSLDVK